MSLIKHKLLQSDEEMLAAVLSAVTMAVTSVQRETGFGSIEITVHDGRVTQIEKREKIRITLDKPIYDNAFCQKGTINQNC